MGGVNLLWAFITTVFFIALIKIRKLITSVNVNERLKPNLTLMNINLATFALSWILYSIIFVLSILEKKKVEN